MLEEETAAQRVEGSCSRWESRSAEEPGMYITIVHKKVLLLSAAPELVCLLTPV